ncbi:hypothetical protein HID58_033237 [Brassica napus]|uniref:Uncharacterized protein n=1 Tax=Brassica napus TaxID=3708 RepID=A0ABQ8BYN6_BRANA|nr:hypothetical protein HID58_033237 [Brassica napus]
MKARKMMMNLLKEAVLKKRALGEELGKFFKIICGEKEEGKAKMSVEEKINITYIHFFLIANQTTPRILAATVKLISEKLRVMRERARCVLNMGRLQIHDFHPFIEYLPFCFFLTASLLGSHLVLRKPDNDIQVGDYTIPACWTFIKGYAAHGHFHHNLCRFRSYIVLSPNESYNSIHFSMQSKSSLNLYGLQVVNEGRDQAIYAYVFIWRVEALRSGKSPKMIHSTSASLKGKFQKNGRTFSRELACLPAYSLLLLLYPQESSVPNTLLRPAAYLMYFPSQENHHLFFDRTFSSFTPEPVTPVLAPDWLFCEDDGSLAGKRLRLLIPDESTIMNLTGSSTNSGFGFFNSLNAHNLPPAAKLVVSTTVNFICVEEEDSGDFSFRLENFFTPGMRKTMLSLPRSLGCSERHPLASKRGHTASQKISLQRALLRREPPLSFSIISSHVSELYTPKPAGTAAEEETVNHCFDLTGSVVRTVRSSLSLPIATASTRDLRPTSSFTELIPRTKASTSKSSQELDGLSGTASRFIFSTLRDLRDSFMSTLTSSLSLVSIHVMSTGSPTATALDSEARGFER